MKNLYLITKEDFMNLVKNPMWIFYTTLFPLILISILGYLTNDSYGKSVTSYDYYVVTMMIYFILSSGMTSANTFMEERIKKPNMRIIFAPGPVRNIYVSKIISSFLFGVIFHLIDIVLLTVLFHVHWHAIGYLFILFILGEWMSKALGVMLCCVCKTEALTNQILSIVINLFAVLGGLLFPIDGYGRVIRMIAACSPAKWVSDTVFGLIYDDCLSLFYGTTLGLIIISIVIMIVCEKTFHKEDCIC